SVLSSKIADIVEINHTVLWSSTVLVVVILALVTFYKTKVHKEIKIISPINLRVTKNLVSRIIIGILYIPASLILSQGAFQLAQMIDQDWLGIISGISISSTIIFAPILIQNAKEENLLTWPFMVGFLFSLIFSGTGYYLIVYPESFKNMFLFYVAISVMTMVALKYVYLYYTFYTAFDKWYKKLPES
ncbi:MAG: hypothetical protein ACOY0R_00250, partial [Chloroflexota bacterium]